MPGCRRLRYPDGVHAFEYDLAFEPGEIASGLERLFDTLHIPWTCTRRAPASCEFRLTLSDGHHAAISVQPLPSQRMNYIGLFPRTLLEARTESGADLTDLRRQITLAFLRVMG